MSNPWNSSRETENANAANLEAGDDIDLEFWRLCDELTIQQASLLLAGVSPSKMSDVEYLNISERPVGYEASKTAIQNALRVNAIEGVIQLERAHDAHGVPFEEPGTVGVQSRISVQSLKDWLRKRGFRRGFFFPEKIEAPAYLDPANPRYAPKLAAAVAAWTAITDPGNKHPKQALAKWLRENAKSFGLTDEDGKPNETGIEEAAKVANWQPGGGAPKTPSGSEPTPD